MGAGYRLWCALMWRRVGARAGRTVVIEDDEGLPGPMGQFRSALWVVVVYRRSRTGRISGCSFFRLWVRIATLILAVSLESFIAIDFIIVVSLFRSLLSARK